MVELEKYKKIHIEFINWLENQKDIPNIEEYISYVKEKLNIYDKSSDIRIVKNLTRSMNRYRDEFNFDYDRIKQTYLFFKRMDKAIIDPTQQF